jgi:hypothetical protein
VTQPTDIPSPPPPADAAPGAAPGAAPPPEGQEQPLNLRRTLRTATSESYDLVGADAARLGTLTVVYGPDAVEGLFALPADTSADMVRGLLGWVTDMLSLDVAVGPGGQIHWVVSTGPLEDFWRRSPGRRSTGAEDDLDVARARVESVLRSMFPEVIELDDGGHAVDVGSVRVFAQTRMVDASAMVRVFSITNVDVPLDNPALAPFLLGINFTLALGRFSVDAANRAVWCDHVLTAHELDDSSLARAIAAVAATADRYDDEIKARFGGRTFREEGSPVAQVPPAGGPGMAGGYL